MTPGAPARRAGAASRRQCLASAVAGVVAVALGILLLVQAERSVFGRVPVLDEVWYLDRAAALQGLSAPADQPHFMSPLYPVLIKLAGSAHAVPADRVVAPAMLRGLRLVQLGCWLGLLVLLRAIAGRLLPAATPRRGFLVWVPTLLAGLYRPAAVYAMAVLLELPLIFLVTLALWLLLGLAERRRPLPQAALVGAILGCAGLLRGTAWVLVPLAAWWVGRRVRRGAWRGVLAVVVPAVLVAMPAAWHDTRIAGRPAGPVLNGGVNLLIGNGPAANGFYVAVIDGDWRADPAGTQQLAAQTGTAAVSVAEADRLWTRRAWNAMTAHPGRTLGLWLKKVWLHLQAWEIDQLTPLAGWTATVPVLRLWVVPWALVVVLGLVGAADLAGRRPGGGWALVLATTGVLLAAQSVFFVVSRYRLALLPAFALLAAAGLAGLLARRRRAWVALPLALLLVVPWGLGGVRGQWRAMGLANEALRYRDLAVATGDAAARDRAEGLYRAALAAGAPGEAPWLGLAAVLEARGAVAASDSVLATGARRLPRAPGLQKARALRALAQGDAAAAEPLLRAVLSLRPRRRCAPQSLRPPGSARRSGRSPGPGPPPGRRPPRRPPGLERLGHPARPRRSVRRSGRRLPGRPAPPARQRRVDGESGPPGDHPAALRSASTSHPRFFPRDAAGSRIARRWVVTYGNRALDGTGQDLEPDGNKEKEP